MRFSTIQLFLILFSLVCGSACHTTKWNDLQVSTEIGPPPQEIISFFDTSDYALRILACSPAFSYKYDIGEKDQCYGADTSDLRFKSVEITLHMQTPKDKILCDLTFSDDNHNQFIVNYVDLLRLVPTLNAPGEMCYPEYLLEEYNRFGYVFRKEHKEFAIKINPNASKTIEKSFQNAYRCQITNNCLSPGKWEFEVVSEEYGDFKHRLKSELNLNQNRILAHSWFKLDQDLYNKLIRIKNPFSAINLNIPYEELSTLSEQVTIDFNQIRSPLKYRANSRMLEVGHLTKRKIEPLDIEQHYKKQFGLLLDDQEHSYASILQHPIKTAQFKDEGFYTESTPKEFDLNWMQYLDSVTIDILEVANTDAYAEITITGQWTPYNITIGNVDLAQIDEQKLLGFLFGFNTYPKSRRYNPVQSTISYDEDLLPDQIRPYVLLTDKKTGKWVNNQYKGIEKIYLTYEGIERNVLNIYVLLYERIIPVWMARVELPKDLRERVRIRQRLYTY